MCASRIVSRLSPRLPSLSFNGKSMITPSISPLKSSSPAAQLFPSSNRISSMSRLPVELSCLVSMMPLHSAIASCRMKSFLSVGSQSWGLIPQGISMPLLQLPVSILLVFLL